MAFDPGLTPGAEINNTELCEIFGCSPQGGIRPSRSTNTLVLISNRRKSIYVDEWKDGVLHYTGTGQEGDQRLDYGRNKTLARSAQTGIEPFVFEVFQDKHYTFVGRVQLADDPYSESQPDKNGVMRAVWVFPLRLVDGDNAPAIPEHTFTELQRSKESTARKLTDAELIERARQAKGGSGSRSVLTKTHERDPYVSEYAKRRAQGICQLCGGPAPFRDRKGEPFLETHHIEWLSRGGADTIDNTVALCPNCHRKMHALNSPRDVERLESV